MADRAGENPRHHKPERRHQRQQMHGDGLRDLLVGDEGDDGVSGAVLNHNYSIADIDGINHEVVEFLAAVDGAASA
jgi:hypothetical protein